MKAPVKIVFINNPVSGIKKKKPDQAFIKTFFDSNFNISFFDSAKNGHASELTAKAVENGADAVVAIGGDGTVNEIARALNGTSCALGIIPTGSGNGLARHHKISFIIPEAIKCIKQFKVIDHDAISINGRLSFNVSGIGFDAHVAHLFGKNGVRGFNSYMKLVIKEFLKYKEKEIRVETSSGIINDKVLFAAIANASQFGNNALIAPAADTNDGIVDITLVRKMNGWQLPMFIYNVFNSKVGNSNYSKLLKGEKFIINCEDEMPLHLDGEPAGYANRFDITTLKSSLKIIIP